ncbi:MAG: oxidoreductase [Bacteroidales bacterium]|nr:oxidoreductase [Bacteroidales bacterium]
MNTWNDLKYKEVLVVDNKNLAKDAYILTFKRTFNFVAGQVVGLGINTLIEPRLYSIASGENDDYVEILYTEKADGKLTPMLSLLKKGDKILVSSPFGSFTENNDSPILIATGTGIAPFISMLKSGKGRAATLIHGVSFPDYFYYADYLEKELGDRYIRCCSKFYSTDYFNGRVTQYIQEHQVDPNKKYYLCGVAEMVVDTRDILISKGIPYRNILAEIYF